MTLIFDIETKTFGRPNPDKDEFKFIGLYEVEQDQYHFLSDIEEINKIFRKHKVVVGFNSFHYDEPIMKRAGMFGLRHLHIDLRDVVKKRETILRVEKESKSMANLAKVFGLSEDKGSFDYDLLKKESLTDEEYELIKEYTLQDIKVTYEMYKYLCDYFKPFKEYLSKYDNMQYKWLTSSVSVYAYKVICNLAGIKEEYDSNAVHKKYPGGFVAEPSKAEEHHNIYCLDYNSLYPHIMIQANLFAYKCKCCEDKYNGNDFFKLTGGYCKKKLHPIGKVIHDIYLKRKELKRLGDRREQALKLVLNTSYGLTGNPVFKNLYHYEAAYDCTLIARESCKLARKMFKDAGYDVLYSDTDSVYLKDVYNDKPRMLEVKEQIIKKLKDNLAFPVDTFDMGIDDEIKHIWFFKNNGHFLKKHYIYVTNTGKLVVKGLSMIKRDSSKIGLIVFNKYMKPEVLKGNIKFSYQNISEWVKTEIEHDLMLVTRTFTVNDSNTYANENQLQAQISRKYGEGRHKLLANNCIGAGISVKYCTVEEFKDKGYTINALNLNKFWSEMEHFSNYVPKATTMKKKINQLSLGAWAEL